VGIKEGLDQEAFDALLAWLDPDREHAGQKYEEIRARLIKYFVRRGCPISEELADVTIERVTRKVRDLAAGYVGDPALYFYGVAHKVYLEYQKKKPDPLPLPPPDPPDHLEKNDRCLERCLQKLDSQTRNLILQYYKDDRRAKIDHRGQLARQMGIPLNTLRMRMHRIRLSLRECVEDCLNQSDLR
jgi:DNA-directed RNA polymerase specialized sigma24 family protein